MLIPSALLVVWAMPSMSGQVQAIGAALTIVGVLLDPQFFSKPVFALISFKKMPVTSRILIAVGMATYLGGIILGQYSNDAL